MTFKEMLDYVLKGTVGALLAACTALGTWVWQAQSRIEHLDTEVAGLHEDVAKLQSQDERLQTLQTDLAVVKSQQQATSKQLDRIEALLAR